MKGEHLHAYPCTCGEARPRFPFCPLDVLIPSRLQPLFCGPARPGEPQCFLRGGDPVVLCSERRGATFGGLETALGRVIVSPRG
jgi:hypothetical protein